MYKFYNYKTKISQIECIIRSNLQWYSSINHPYKLANFAIALRPKPIT